MYIRSIKKEEEKKRELQILTENDFIKAEIEVKWTPEVLTWKVKKIPYKLWCEVVSFFKDTQEHFKSEAMVRLYIHSETHEWRAWAYPQEAKGLSVKELVDHEQRAIDLLQFGDDWMQLGSIHHHCSIGASQSGTDYADEVKQEGIHITCGNVDKDEITTHCRYSLKQAFFKVELEDFIETEAISGLTKNIQSKKSIELLSNNSTLAFLLKIIAFSDTS